MLNKLPLIPLTELLAKALAFLIVILLTRILSVEEYGLFNYIVSLVMMVSVLMDGGINNYIFNKSVKNELSEISDYFNSRIVLSLIIIVILLLFVYFIQREYFIYVFFYSLFVFFNSSLSFFKMLARGQEYKKIDIQTIILDPFFRLLILSIVFIFGLKIYLLETLEIFLFIEFFIFFLIYLSIRHKFNITFSVKKIYIKLKTILLDSKYFLFYYLFFVGIQRMDVLFMGHTMDNEAVALFSSAYNLYMVILLFFSSFLTSGFKSILESKVKLIQYIKSVTVFYILIALTVLISIKWIYIILYPAEYLDASYYLKLFMFSLPFTIVSYFGIYYFNYANKSHLNVLIMFFFFLIKALCLFVFDFKYINDYIYLLITIEILLGITYLFLLIRNLKETYQ